jgi:hypothetical protein
MFIKHGDGKIVTVIEEEQLTSDQKKSVKDQKKQSEDSEKKSDK